jgi:hypothetical protein
MSTDSSQYPLLIPEMVIPAARRDSTLSLTLETSCNPNVVYDTPVSYDNHMYNMSEAAITKAGCISSYIQ